MLNLGRRALGLPAAARARTSRTRDSNRMAAAANHDTEVLAVVSAEMLGEMIIGVAQEARTEPALLDAAIEYVGVPDFKC